MCRYATSYKEHFACFNCRKAFKRPAISDLPQQPRAGEARVVLCPQCRQRMVDLGRDFKAPKQGDVKQWRKVAKLYENGIIFSSCGCCGPGARPGKLQDVEAFLTERAKATIEARRLREVEARAAKLRTKRKKAREKVLAKRHRKSIEKFNA